MECIVQNTSDGGKQQQLMNAWRQLQMLKNGCNSDQKVAASLLSLEDGYTSVLRNVGKRQCRNDAHEWVGEFFIDWIQKRMIDGQSMWLMSRKWKNMPQTHHLSKKWKEIVPCYKKISCQRWLENSS